MDETSSKRLESKIKTSTIKDFVLKRPVDFISYVPESVNLVDADYQWTM